MDARKEQQDRENKERHSERDKERQLKEPSDNGAFETSNVAETNTQNNSGEAEITGSEASNEHLDEVDSVNQSAKRNRYNRSRNGRGRRRDENNEKDGSVEVRAEDVSSIEAAE